MNFAQSLPFLVFIFVGVLSGRLFALDKRSFSRLLIYFVAPMIFFISTWGSDLRFEHLSLPLMVWAMASVLAALAYRVSHRFMGTPECNLLGFSMGSANSGYFGLPVAAALYGEAFLPKMILVVMGFTLYEYTTGFYITARSHFSVRASIKKLVSLPATYAFLVAIVFNELGFARGEWMGPLENYMKGAYSFLGLMVLGLGLADISWKSLDLKFLLSAFGARFVAWPVSIALILIIFGLDSNSVYYKALSLVAFLPMAANGVVIATELKASPQKIAGAIALSTLVSLVMLNSNMHLSFIHLFRVNHSLSAATDFSSKLFTTASTSLITLK